MIVAAAMTGTMRGVWRPAAIRIVPVESHQARTTNTTAAL
jgi:hypothetical protein